MQKIIIMLALLSISTSCLYADETVIKDANTIVSTYNQLADLTTVETSPVKVMVGDRSVTAQASYSYEGKVVQRPAVITFRLSTVNPKQVWSEIEDSIYIKYGNGDKVAKGPAELLLQMTSSTESSVVTETLTAQIPIDIYETIFSEKEIIIGLRGNNTPPFKSTLRENYPFGEDSLKPIKELAKSIPSQK